MVEYWQASLLMLIGCISGFLNVVAGGGSLLTVPVMIFMGMPGPVANGTNRIAILAQNITAIYTFCKKGFSDFRLSVSLAMASLPGALLGAYAGTRLEGVWFNRVLAVIMFVVMILMSVERKSKPSGKQSGKKLDPKRYVQAHLLMLGVGVYGGFIQVGVGFILMPILYRVLGLDLVRVNMHKVFIVACYTVVALCVFASQIQLMWVLGAFLAAGHVVGGWLGAHFSIKRGESLIKMVLNGVLVIFIIKLLFFP